MFFPTSKFDVSLPPPSINIVLFDGVSINVQSPCPTSTKYIFKFLGITRAKKMTKMLMNSKIII